MTGDELSSNSVQLISASWSFNFKNIKKKMFGNRRPYGCVTPPLAHASARKCTFNVVDQITEHTTSVTHTHTLSNTQQKSIRNIIIRKCIHPIHNKQPCAANCFSIQQSVWLRFVNVGQSLANELSWCTDRRGACKPSINNTQNNKLVLFDFHKIE